MSLHWSEGDYQAYLRTRGVWPMPEVSEKLFLATVTRVARDAGFLCYHTWRSKRSPEGFPDLVLVHPTRPRETSPVFLVELKTATGQVTPAQAAWVDALDARTTVSALWRPDDLEMIRRWLTA